MNKGKNNHVELVQKRRKGKQREKDTHTEELSVRRRNRMLCIALTVVKNTLCLKAQTPRNVNPQPCSCVYVCLPRTAHVGTSSVFLNSSSQLFFFLFFSLERGSITEPLPLGQTGWTASSCLSLLPRPRVSYMWHHIQTQTWVFMLVQEALYTLSHPAAPESVPLTTVIPAFHLILLEWLLRREENQHIMVRMQVKKKTV